MRYDVADVGILLDRHEFVNPHAAESADAAQVISLEIDEHEVLRPFFFICKQFTNEALIVVRVKSAWPGSSNRACVCLPIVQTDEPFG